MNWPFKAFMCTPGVVIQASNHFVNEDWRMSVEGVNEASSLVCLRMHCVCNPWAATYATQMQIMGYHARAHRYANEKYISRYR